MHLLRPVVVATAATCSFLAGAVPAVAGGGSGHVDDGGLTARASVQVTLSGDVGAGGTAAVSAPALCWWEPIPYTTAALHAFMLGGSMLPLGPGVFFAVDADTLARVLEDEKKNKVAYEWYGRRVREGASAEQLAAAGCNDPSGPYRGLFTGLLFRPFEPGQPPAPLPDPRTMAEVAVEHIGIEPPALDWNPRMRAPGGGTLVNLPSWFWVTNPGPAVGGETGERRVVATAGSGDTTVRVTVVADPGGLMITSPGGATTCSVEAARTSYSAGVDESEACVLVFERASWAYADGFPTRASVRWTVTWTGTGPGTDGALHALPGITEAATAVVPVAESQALVTAVN